MNLLLWLPKKQIKKTTIKTQQVEQDVQSVADTLPDPSDRAKKMVNNISGNTAREKKTIKKKQSHPTVTDFADDHE